MSSKHVAVRWPVRFAARWLARLEASSPLIRMVSLAVTGLSTGLLVLKQYGYGQYARLFLGVGAVGAFVFIYFYTEEGVYNQQKRDVSEFGANYPSPRNRIDDEMIARGALAGLNGEQLTAAQREAIKDELDQAYAELRDGVDIPDSDTYGGTP